MHRWPREEESVMQKQLETSDLGDKQAYLLMYRLLQLTNNRLLPINKPRKLQYNHVLIQHENSRMFASDASDKINSEGK